MRLNLYNITINIIILTIIYLILFPKALLSEEILIPNIGDKIPSFELNGFSKTYPHKGTWSNLDIDNKWSVIYFYPKDFTSGCTIEAKKFDQLNKQFVNRQTTVIGISNDNVDSHESFCEKEGLDIVLLTDKDGILSKKFGSWTKPFSKRNTFLVNPKGVIAYTWVDVNPANHPKDVLTKLIEIQG